MLTALSCKSIITQSKQLDRSIKKFDGKGLFLHAMPDGSAFWRYKYRVHGKEKLISFGPYPILGLAEAREKHALAYQQVLAEIDPSAAKQQAGKKAQQAQRNTFEAVGRAWYKHNIERWSPDHQKTIMLRLKKDLFQSIGHVPVTALTRKQLLEALQKIEQRKSHEVARRSLQFARNILTYAQNEELVENNVAQGLEGAMRPYRRGHFPSMEIAMLPEFLRKLERNEARLTMDTRDAMTLLMLTLVRTSELIKAEWTEINLDTALWIIPAEKMKMRREHVVPLSRQVVAIIRRRQTARELLDLPHRSKYVFPSQLGPHKHMCERTVGLALFAMGYRDVHTGHGFRALGMGIAKEKLGYRHEVPDRQLAHVPADEVRRSYDRAMFLEERTEMMQRLANYVDSAISHGL